MNSPDMNPFMYQDLMSSNNGMLPPLGMSYMTGMYPTNMLGGTRMQAQPDTDKFIIMKQKDKQERNAFLISLAALTAIGGSAALLFKGKVNFGGIGKAIAAPFKKLGGASKSAGTGATSGIGRLGGKTKNGIKSLGHLLIAPFKFMGKGICKGGQAVAVFFKTIKEKSGKFFKRGKKNSTPSSEIKGILEPPKTTPPQTPPAGKPSGSKKEEVLTPDKIIMPEKKVKESKKNDRPQIINIS